MVDDGAWGASVIDRSAFPGSCVVRGSVPGLGRPAPSSLAGLAGDLGSPRPRGEVRGPAPRSLRRCSESGFGLGNTRSRGVASGFQHVSTWKPASGLLPAERMGPDHRV